MQPHALTLLALFAPAPLAAFGDMDCVVTEACDATGCSALAEVYEVTFDWSAETATVVRDGEATTLTMRPPPPLSDGDTIARALEFARDSAHGINFFRLEESNGEVSALILEAAPGARSSLAICDLRQAA